MTARPRCLLIALLLVVGGTCVRLGIWQRHRLTERRTRNTLAIARRIAQPLPLDPPAPVDSLPGRRVITRGQFDQPHSFVLRGRVYNDIPGVEVVTPLVRAEGPAVLVDRGFIPSADAVTAPVDSFVEPGPVDVDGVALGLESRADSGTPILAGGHVSWRRIDLAAAERRLPYPILPIVVVRRPVPDSAGWPRRQEAPALDEGPHFNYMLQWFGFALTAFITAGLIAFQQPGRDPPPA